MRLSTLLSVMVLACGSPEAPPTSSATAPPPTSSVTAPPATAPPVTAPAATSIALPGPAPAGSPTGAAFVIATWATDAQSTVVVPIDASAPARSVDALLVLGGTPARVTAFGWSEGVDWLEAPGLLRCAEGCARTCDEESHGLGRVQIDPSSFETAMLDCDACVPFVAPPEESDEDEEESDEEDEEESDEPCEGGSGEPRTIVGGRVFVPLDYHTECGGLNVYALDLASFPLVSDAWTPTWPIAPTRCDGDPDHPEWFATGTPMVEAVCSRSASGHFSADCADCERTPRYIVPSVWNGVLHFDGANGDGGPNGGSMHWQADVPLLPRNCPSSADPCGDPAGYDTAIHALGTSDRYWIATDGSAALVLAAATAFGPVTARVLVPGNATPTRELHLPFGHGDVVSVRFHADAAPLARVVDHGISEIRAPVACGDAPSCDYGQRRVGAACEAIALAPDDAALHDTHRGSDWGNRCAIHLRATELDAAEAACARGLAIADRGTTRGALLYNLGRIAEARGDRDAARRAYEASLVARPGNAPTRAALDAL